MKNAHQKICTAPEKRIPTSKTQDIASLIQRISTDSSCSSSIKEASTDRVRPIRPARLKARRGLEFLCLMESNDFDWYDIDEVDASGLEIPPEQSTQHGTPILSDLTSIWSDNE